MINVYTEEEAKKKICCIADTPTDLVTCCASECMAWRYIETFDPETLTQKMVAGYCGLAGKP